MPVNAGYEYFEVEKHYLEAKTLDDKIYWLEQMIRKAPKHKSSENMLAGLRLRLKKFKGQLEKAKKSGGGSKGIRKEGFQVVLVGKTGGGKSCLLSKITNASPRISESPFTTTYPEVGTMNYEGVRTQIVDIPSIGSTGFDIGLVNNADCLLLVVQDIDELKEIESFIPRAFGSRIIVINKIDLLDYDEKRRLDARCRASRLKDFVIASCFSGEGLDELKKMIFEKMKVIRVYTKEPGKKESRIPVVLKEGSKVRDVAESILKGFSEKVKEIRLTGPSAKFTNQRVGLSHVLKDKDIVEFHTY